MVRMTGSWHASIVEEISIQKLWVAGPVQNVITALPNAHSWKAIREEIKEMFLRSNILRTCSHSIGKHDSKAQ